MEEGELAEKSDSGKETWTEHVIRIQRERSDWHDYAVKWIQDQTGRKVTGTYLQDPSNGILTETWPTDPDHVSVAHRENLGTFFVLTIRTKRDTSKQMGDMFPEHVSVYYDGKKYWACIGTPGLKAKRDWKGWMPFGNMNCMLNSFGLPTIGKENAYQLLMLNEWNAVRKQGWDIDQEMDDLRHRKDQIKIWRTAGTVALITSKGDQLKYQQLVTEYGKDWYSPSDYAQILTGCGKQAMLPSRDIVPEAVRCDWDRAEAAGKAKPRDSHQGYFDSDTFELMTPEYLPRADLSMKNLIKSYS